MCNLSYNVIPLFIQSFSQLYKSTEFLSVDVCEPCKECAHIGENWLCLMCSMVYCSRYVNSHMVAHNAEEPGHMIALSYSDISVWCYECDSCKFIYLINFLDCCKSKIVLNIA